MASIAKEPNGRRRILFTAPDGKRKTIRLGKMPQRAAEAICTKVEALLAAAMSSCPWDAETARWVADLPDHLAGKLAQVGLIPKRLSASLEGFILAYVDERVDVKPATKEIWGQGQRGLVGFLGANVALRDVTAGDADRYKLHLAGAGLAPMTIRKRLQFAKTIFRAAARRKLIPSNPFDGVNVEAAMPDRQRFVNRDETAKVLDACPNHDWRTIVALCRYGGLRSPSEVLSLRLDDVDWEQDRIRVTSPKTAHHPGKG